MNLTLEMIACVLFYVVFATFSGFYIIDQSVVTVFTGCDGQSRFTVCAHIMHNVHR